MREQTAAALRGHSEESTGNEFDQTLRVGNPLQADWQPSIETKGPIDSTHEENIERASSKEQARAMPKCRDAPEGTPEEDELHDVEL